MNTCNSVFEFKLWPYKTTHLKMGKQVSRWKRNKNHIVILFLIRFIYTFIYLFIFIQFFFLTCMWMHPFTTWYMLFMRDVHKLIINFNHWELIYLPHFCFNLNMSLFLLNILFESFLTTFFSYFSIQNVKFA